MEQCESQFDDGHAHGRLQVPVVADGEVADQSAQAPDEAGNPVCARRGGEGAEPAEEVTLEVCESDGVSTGHSGQSFPQGALTLPPERLEQRDEVKDGFSVHVAVPLEEQLGEERLKRLDELLWVRASAWFSSASGT